MMKRMSCKSNYIAYIWHSKHWVVTISTCNPYKKSKFHDHSGVLPELFICCCNHICILHLC